MKYRRCFLLMFVPLTMYFSGYGMTQISDSIVLQYFKAQIGHFEQDRNLELDSRAFTRLKSKMLERRQGEIWDLWKQANMDFPGLPEAALADTSLKNYPVSKWMLPDEDPMPFYFLIKGNKPDNGYPLFLNLHGSGPKEMEFANTLSWSLRYKDAPSAYFIPQIPNVRRYRWWYKPEQHAWEKLFRLAMVSGEIDPNKIYITGISEGGYGSQRLGAFYADYLAGAGPMAGGEPLENAPPSNYRNIAFSFQTGAHDNGFGRNKLTALAQHVFDSLAKENPGYFVHKIELQANRGHGIDYTKTTPWLIQYDRNPQPSMVSWTHFPMHGRYRNGFYNISIDDPLNIQEGDEFDRALFNLKMDKETNVIILDVKLQNPEGTKTQAVNAGTISIYLSPELVDLTKRVKLVYNGKEVFNKRLTLSERNLIESCALFGDPERLFPAKITIDL